MALQIEKVLINRFEFSLNGGTVISTIYPRLTTDGNTCNFKTVTGANLIKKQNISVSDITIIDTFGGSGTFNYTTVSEMWFKLTELNFWGSDTGAGVTSFQALSDTDGFFGNDGKVLIVNQAENKIDYTTFYNINEFKQLSDVEIASLIDGKILGVTLVSGVPKITLINKPTDGTTYFSAVGGFDYDDLITSTTPLVYTSGNLALSNDTLGANTFLTQPPYGVTSTWNEATNSFDFSELSEGDEVFLRVNIDHTTSTANQITKLFLQFDDGSVIFNVGIDENIQDKSSGVHNITRTIHFYVRDAWKNNPVYLYYSSDAGSTIDVNGWHPYIIRKSINVLDINDDNFKTFRVSQVASPTVDVSTIAGTVKIGYNGTSNKITNILFDNEFSDYLSAYASITSTNTLYLKVYNKTKKISLVAKITAFNYTDGTNNHYNVSLENTIDYTDVNVLNVLEFDVSVSDAGGGSFTSPLTTKGDILSYTTEDVRIPVGSDGQVLVADSTEAAGVKWDNNTGAALTDKLTVLATLGQTGTTLSPIPNSIDLYKNGQWLIEDTDFTYNNTTGVITWDASLADDYYEIRPYNSIVSNDGVVLESDTTTAAMNFVIDEDDMVSDSSTKIPTQQSVKAYVDAKSEYYGVEIFTGSKVLASTDHDKILKCATGTLVLPLNDSVSLPIGFKVILKKTADARVEFITDGGVAIEIKDTELNFVDGIYDAVELVKEDTNLWGVYGANATGISLASYENVLNVSDTSLNQVTYLQVYKSSDWSDLFTFDKNYFCIYSTDHETDAAAKIMWGEMDDPYFTNFSEIAEIITPNDGYQQESPYLFKVLSADSGLTEEAFMTYHTSPSDPDNNGGAQESHLIISTGGNYLHLSSWVEKNQTDGDNVFGLEIGDNHTGYSRQISLSGGGYLAYHARYGDADPANNLSIFSSSSNGFDWARVASSEVDESGVLTDGSGKAYRRLDITPFYYSGTLYELASNSNGIYIATPNASTYKPATFIADIANFKHTGATSLFYQYTFYIEGDYMYIYMRDIVGGFSLIGDWYMKKTYLPTLLP